MIRMNDLCVLCPRYMVCTRLMNEKTPAETVIKKINNNNNKSKTKQKQTNKEKNRKKKEKKNSLKISSSFEQVRNYCDIAATTCTKIVLKSNLKL